MIGRDKSRRSLTGSLVKNKRRASRRRRTREPTGRAEEKYIGLRAGMSPSIWLDDVLDQQLKMHLHEDYRDNAETEATMKITGYLEATRKAMKWKATKSDMMRWFKLAEAQRWDKGFGLTKADAVARFFTGHGTKSIKSRRPSEFMAKPTTPYYPRRGSSAGKIATRQIGAKQVERDFKKLMETLFSLGDSFNKGKTKMPKFDVARTISQTIDD